VRDLFPDMLLCVASNGLNVAPFVKELKAIEVSHVTITINAIYPTIGAQIYAWVRKNKRVDRGEEGAKELLASQVQAVDKLVANGITTKINTIVIPGINQDHVVDIAKAFKKRGADIMNCMPLYPVEGAKFEKLKAPKKEVMQEILKEVARHLPIMNHCARCRADAAGLVGSSTPAAVEELLSSISKPDDADARPYVAAASREGLLVNQHLGEADFFRVFAPKKEGGFEEVEKRVAPEPGGGDARWQSLAALLKDCRALLVSESGEHPKKVLERNGVQVIPIEGLVDVGLQAIYEGRRVSLPSLKRHRCGVGCSGDGMGCG
jgi:nitrogen fixation protein NifB